MPLTRRVLACFFVAALAGCARAHTAAPQPSLPPLMIDDRGIVMPLEEAVTKISYRPWIPPGEVLKVAVIPPLGGLDLPRTRGIAVEYQAGRLAMLLSEWPQQNFTLLFARNQDVTFTPCKVVFYKRDGVAWTTHAHLAMTLQPDGSATSKAVADEARRLIAAGACR
ncbi:MAG: hypothetical protein KGN02_10230 [bacterium]|nr:hypothetical protein [bacterium]